MKGTIEKRIMAIEKKLGPPHERRLIVCLHGDAPCSCKEEKARLEAEGKDPQFMQIVFVPAKDGRPADVIDPKPHDAAHSSAGN